MKTAAWNDQRLEQLIGYLLITGVLLSALIVLIGGIIYLTRHGSEAPNYHTFQGEPEGLRTVRGLFSSDSLHHGRGLMQLGLVLLVLTPIARVAFAFVGFCKERDWMYAGISAIVLGVLVYSVTST